MGCEAYGIDLTKRARAVASHGSGRGLVRGDPVARLLGLTGEVQERRRFEGLLHLGPGRGRRSATTLPEGGPQTWAASGSRAGWGDALPGLWRDRARSPVPCCRAPTM